MAKVVNDEGELVKAGCVVLDEHHKILLVTTRDGKYWGLPKGHVEPDEDLQQAAVRETLEETGYRVQIITRLDSDLCYIHARTGQPIRVAFFLATPEEHKGEAEGPFAWKPLAEVKGLVADNVYEYLSQVLQS